MCQSWLHFLMHHQQMWLLWVPFHMAAPTSLLTSRLTFPLWTPHTHTYLPLQTPRLTSSYLSSISFSEPPASTHLFHWLSLNLFHILPEGVISGSSVAMCLHYRGIHFMSIYLLVEHHQRVWWIWTEKKKKDCLFDLEKDGGKGPVNALRQLFHMDQSVQQ